MQRLVVGISGASGIILARHLIEHACKAGFAIDLVMSSEALYTARYELDSSLTTAKRFVEAFDRELRHHITLHPIQDVGSTIASGSYPTYGMVIIPCSMATVASLAVGLGDNALRRAADVTIKEKRPLVIVPRESPLSELHLENLYKLARLGVTIVPPMPAWYTNPQSVQEIELFIVGKTLDALKIPHALYPRWQGVAPGSPASH